MSTENYINKIINLYFSGYSVDEAIKLTKAETKINELKDISQTWECKFKNAKIKDSKGWKYQQASFI